MKHYFFTAWQSAGFDCRAEGIIEAAILLPNIVLRLDFKIACSFPRQLQEVFRRIDVAVSRRVEAISKTIGKLTRHTGRWGLNVKDIVFSVAERAGDFLSETTARGGYTEAFDGPFRGVYLFNGARRERGHAGFPELA